MRTQTNSLVIFAALVALVYFSLMLVLPPTAKAEYRVFNLKIDSADGTSFRQELSSLDPDQYRGYYHAKPGEKITYTDTWMCKGRTSDFKEFCPNPKGPNPNAPQATQGANNLGGSTDMASSAPAAGAPAATPASAQPPALPQAPAPAPAIVNP